MDKYQYYADFPGRGMFRNIFSSVASPVEEEGVPELTDDQNNNPFSTALVLSTQPNVEKIIKLGPRRILSSGHDYKGVVWDSKNGEIVCELIGHARLINCAIMLENYQDYSKNNYNVIVTGSSDQTLRVWDINNGNCLKVVNSHESGVKCMNIILAEPKLIVSGGQNVCVWNDQCRLLTQYQRNSLDYIHTVIVIQEFKIVAATDQPFLVIYEIHRSIDPGNQENIIYTIRKPIRLPQQRESVTSLINISDATFASASMDGAIIIWSSLHLTALRKFNLHDKFVSLSDHTHPYSVQCIFVEQQNYLFAAIGCGFSIFDIRKDICICQVTQAHQSQVTCIALLDEGLCVATSSLDGTVRLWTGAHKHPTGNVLTNPIDRLFGTCVKEPRLPASFPMKLIGVCYGHSNSILAVADLGKDCFVSYGSDGVIILWKNSEKLEKRKDQQLSRIFQKYGWLNE